WDNFFIPTPIRFIQLPSVSPTLYVSKSSFLQMTHPGLIGTTKKLSYSQTGKLESPD
ncbi:unnamed protein product, partial [Brassica rapa subsp. trilocularis]